MVNDLFAVRDPSGARLACGLLDRDEMIERYEAAVGWTIDRERLRFYEIFNNYKLAVCAHATTLRIARQGDSPRCLDEPDSRLRTRLRRRAGDAPARRRRAS